MNPNKICFIYCVNDEIKFAESVKYLEQLYIPQGFEIEVLKIDDARSMASGYNYGMKQTDAKYKVYLHQDLLIINRNFIADVVGLFQSAPNLGIVGVTGCKTLPVNAIWWESLSTFGKIYESHTGKMELLAFQEVRSSYEKVSALDGQILITQYDVEWREDLFKGWHFYDVSQCMEFVKAGYEVGIPKQELPWCIHDCGAGINNGLSSYNRYREIFLKEYKTIMHPYTPVLPRKDENFRVVALIASHNDGDVIYHVIGDLIQQGVEVYLLDNASTDNTVEEASRWLGRGLLHIERFPEDAGYPYQSEKEYMWYHILHRKELLANTLDADWFIHHDSDEFRESPWPNIPLAAAIEMVDMAGYSAINFRLLNFRPTDNDFQPGNDVREALAYFEFGEYFNRIQIKAWKKTEHPVSFAENGGHRAEFPDRRIYPIDFLLRHYPIRSQEHGLKKIFHERKSRFNQAERNGRGWHFQYDHVQNEGHTFIHDKHSLILFDPILTRLAILDEMNFSQSVQIEIERAVQLLEAINEYEIGSLLRERYLKVR
ncbi:glycosyltransferase [Paenibacillus chartarius]|uniref:Glycosyltransferase n=1 Tax=Paenibacillus chartarius TaxID=747481 RepID=A0ABV6DJT2_9BACL